jgi:hypothetical protein
MTTEIPAIAILAAGYHVAGKGGGTRRTDLDADFFRRMAGYLAVISLIWLAAVVLIACLMTLFKVGERPLYTYSQFAIDLRFYIGWAIGLLLAPVPRPKGVLHGSTKGSSCPATPSAFMRCGRRSGVPTPASGSRHE